MVAVGGTAVLVGAILMIDSHRHIGKAGRWQWGGNSIAYKLSE